MLEFMAEPNLAWETNKKTSRDLYFTIYYAIIEWGLTWKKQIQNIYYVVHNWNNNMKYSRDLS